MVPQGPFSPATYKPLPGWPVAGFPLPLPGGWALREDVQFVYLIDPTGVAREVFGPHAPSEEIALAAAEAAKRE